MFSRRPTLTETRRRADLINRARLVRAHGWDDYRAVWSSGEVVGGGSPPVRASDSILLIALQVVVTSPRNGTVRTDWRTDNVSR